MVSTKNIVVLMLMLAAGLVAFMLFYNSDEAKIKRRFKELSSNLLLASAESRLQAAAKSRKISLMLADPCTVIIPTYDIAITIERTDAQSYIMIGRSRFNRLTVTFHDIDVSVQKKGVAEVVATVYVKGSTTGETLEDDFFEARFDLAETEDDWLFTGISEVTVLEK